jgi:Na+/H+-translocating membrane pyrophosphatase
MKFLAILEKAWLAAAVAAIIMAVYNLITIQSITYKVYFPLFCCGFCILIYMNIRGQRRFVDKMKADAAQESKKKEQE